ncbi:MAG TPA: hypothetical protein HPP56_08980 [Nitrospirae bacterium]|nr:hypothetical protein [Nitrospirota bacterium]
MSIIKILHQPFLSLFNALPFAKVSQDFLSIKIPHQPFLSLFFLVLSPIFS